MRRSDTEDSESSEGSVEMPRNRCDSVDSLSTQSIISSSIDSTDLESDFQSVFENCFTDGDLSSEEFMEIENFISNTSEVFKEIDGQNSRHVAVIPVVRPIVSYNKELNEIEMNRIKELSRAQNSFQYLFSPLSKKVIEYNSIKECYQDTYAVSKMDDIVRQFVKFCKRLSPFQDICEGDQLALIKNSIFEVLTIQNMFLYNYDGEYWDMTLVSFNN